MSQDLKKTIRDNYIIYENDECEVVFSKSKPPQWNINQICMSAISKLKEPEGFRNVPVTIIWNEDKFKELLLDLGIKI